MQHESNFHVTRRAQRLQELADLISANLPLAQRGDARAANIVLKSMERESRLLGLDQPVVTANYNKNVGDGLDEMNLEELLAEAKRRGIPVYSHLDMNGQ